MGGGGVVGVLGPAESPPPPPGSGAGVSKHAPHAQAVPGAKGHWNDVMLQGEGGGRAISKADLICTTCGWYSCAGCEIQRGRRDSQRCWEEKGLLITLPVRGEYPDQMIGLGEICPKSVPQDTLLLANNLRGFAISTSRCAGVLECKRNAVHQFSLRG